MRINVYREGTEAVQWYKARCLHIGHRCHLTCLLKERFLADEEIIDYIVVRAIETTLSVIQLHASRY